MTIGENIKKYRKRIGLTQKELGELAGVAAGTIQQYELGKRQPRIEQLQKISIALNVQTADLIGGYEFDETPYGVSPEHPVAFPGLELKASEMGYHIRYGCDYLDYDDSAIWLEYPDGSELPLDIEDLDRLNTETDIYLKFRLEELRKNKNKPSL